MSESIQLIHMMRGSVIESVHRGHMAVVDTSGKLAAGAGNPDYVTYARSSAKFIQAVPVVASGAAEAFGYNEREIAVMCASHGGEQRHVETVAGMLGKLGIGPEMLLCGAHAPYHKPSAEALALEGKKPTALHNNCSGKHTGMLTLAVHMGAPLETYLEPDHPVQKRMLATYAAFAGIPEDSIAIGVDGCGVPVYGTPLKNIALAFARLGTPADPLPSEACRTIVGAVSKHPHMIAGEGRFDTALIIATNGKLVGKMGAEGVFAVTMPGSGLALASKIEDGNQRANYPAVTEALLQLGWLTPEESEKLSSFHRPVIKNWAGTEVGRTVPVFKLDRF
ncbi:asparaginase [Paenibacillus thermotolerans]|uniref:asparaginase n=1 Tax=Paenibacillus thermotolerans TaxID=3027807 RepID=UPI00236855F3|nr:MULTISPECIES: asparaginase [unclassified Paenibacillus]